MENQTKEQREENARLGGTLTGALLGMIVGGLVASISVSSHYKDIIEQNARRIARTHYEPIGNGGALATMHGNLSPERREMLTKVSETYKEYGGEGYFSSPDVFRMCGMRGSRGGR